MATKIPKAPAGLNQAGKRFWQKTNQDFVLDTNHDFERLRLACRCLDEIASAEAVIQKDGLFIEDRFRQKREHPAARLIRDNKTLFCRIIRELNLDIAGATESRPPKLY